MYIYIYMYVCMYVYIYMYDQISYVIKAPFAKYHMRKTRPCFLEPWGPPDPMISDGPAVLQSTVVFSGYI